MKRSFTTLIMVVLAMLAMAQPKYIFYLIGDGMGQNQVLATEMYLAQLEGEIGRHRLMMTTFPVASMASTFSASNSITDSSAAGTCLATGHKTTNHYLGVDPKGVHPNSIAETLHYLGWGVGILTSVSIDHATPGAFYAASQSRSDYYTIGCQLSESGFDFFGGAAFLKPVNPEKEEAPSVYDLCEQAGYTFCRGYNDFLANGIKKEKVILIQEHEGLRPDQKGSGKIPYAIDRQPGDLSLDAITRAAITHLSQKEDRPFFMMIEGGQIDWSCHGNDAATTIQEVLDFDKVVTEVYDFYLKHKDETLIVVTADHETGGMALGNSNYVLHLDLLQNQTVSAPIISDRLRKLRDEKGKKLTYDDVKRLFIETLGLYTKVEVSAEEDAALRATFKLMMKNKTTDSKNLYASLNALSDQAVRLLNKKAKIGWTTSGHSASAVPVYAIGVGAERFSHFMDNSEIMPTLLNIARPE